MFYDPEAWYNAEDHDKKALIWVAYLSTSNGWSPCSRVIEFALGNAYVGHVPGWESTELFVVPPTRRVSILNAITYEHGDVEHSLVREWGWVTKTYKGPSDDDFWNRFFKDNRAKISTVAVAPYWVGAEKENNHAAMKDGEVSGTTDVISPSIAEAYAPEDTPPKEPERIVAETAPMTKERPDAIAEIFDAAAKTREEGASAEHQTQDIADSRFPLYGLGVAGIILGAVSFWGYRRIRCGAGRPKGQGKT
jgi:hypothetical protein